MKDFDFDEIDKAVTGALGSDFSAQEDETPVKEVAKETSQVAPMAEPEVKTTPEVVPLAVPATPSAPAARRTSGRFMDVMHPSSDMRSQSAASAPVRRAPAAFTAPTTQGDELKDDEPKEAKETFEATTDGFDIDSVVGEWSKPVESPFLTNAKVEKRPLGGAGPLPSAAQVLLDAPEEELLLEAPDELRIEAGDYPDPIDFAEGSTPSISQMDELDTVVDEPEHEDVAYDPIAMSAAAELADAEPLEGEPEPTGESVDTRADERMNEPMSEPIAQAIAEEESTGPISISQQYTEQASTAEDSGSIYDTENYHQAITPTGKKRSGFWTVLWIFLLVVLGAGAGVAFYFFVLPML